jgi:hypothetical protein
VSAEPEEPPVPDDEQKKDEQRAESAATPSDPAKAEPQDAPAPSSEGEGGEDRFRPEAIASRIDTLGDESEADRIARLEEEKLRERRKAKKGKKGLESAASKRLAKIGETKVKRPGALGDAVVPEADPLIERTVKLRKWIEHNRQTFGALVAIALLGGGGFLGWTYWQTKHEAEASAMLAQGIADEHGQVSDKDDDDTDKRPSLYPTFKTVAERRDAAIAKYQEVESKFSGTGAAILARLAEAGLLLDKGDAKGAAAAYEDVKASPLAQADAQVRGRALEGVGFADELLAQSDTANKDKHLDDALASYKQLEQVEVEGFKELGKFHEARVLEAKGDRDKAVALLKDVYAVVHEPGENHQFEYLESAVEDRLRQLDGTALPPKAPKGPPGGFGGGGPGQPDMNDPRIQDLIRQLQQQGGAPPVPPP